MRAALVSGIVAAIVLATTALAAEDLSPNGKKAIEAALANIMTLDRPGEIGLATIWDGNKYVQCRYQSKAMLCEAAGARMQPSLGRILVPEKVAKLVVLGWTADASFGNYVQTFAPPVSAEAVAGKIEQVLSEVYDADLGNGDFATDWVKDEACPPRNGPKQNLAGIISDAPSMASTAVHACSYAPPPAPDRAVESAAELIDRYGARVTGELQRLTINRATHVYMILDTPVGYVQCGPELEPEGFYCEAVSADAMPAIAGALTTDRVARLHAAGFADPGRAPNYSKTYRLDDKGEQPVARELLALLYSVYGYTGTTPLKVITEKGS